MELTIQSLHFTSNAELTDLITAKVNKLSLFHSKIELAKVCLKLDNSDKTENKICEIQLVIPGKDIFARRQCKTFEEAANETVEALHRQIEKLKVKFINR